nr:serine/threonine-protein kinase 17A-like [Misgurnus anguillicaudatus]
MLPSNHWFSPQDPHSTLTCIYPSPPSSWNTGARVISGRVGNRWPPPRQQTFSPTGNFLDLEGEHRQQGHGTALQNFRCTQVKDRLTHCTTHTSVIFRVGTPHPVEIRPGRATHGYPEVLSLFYPGTVLLLGLLYNRHCAAGGEIFNQCVAERDEAFKEVDVKRLMRQILEGVAFLHKSNLVHLDLKPQNILLTSESSLGDIKIVDFGLSRLVSSSQEIREIMGTPEYVAPEILNYEPISTATDMWSIGVLAYVMLTGISPFLGDDKQETFLNISQINVSYTEEELKHLDKAAIHFIKSLLIKKPENRFTAEECLEHQWLQIKEEEKDGSTSESVSEPASPGISSHDEEAEDDDSSQVTEELIVMAAYTLGQCRQSSDKEILTPDQKAISKRFKFEEPFSALQEVPGEFIY